jgi:hypothetical protein
MTRAERLAQQEARAKEKLRKDRKKVVQATQKRRGEEKRRRTKQQYLVGKLADDAGLLELDATMLAALFRLLGPLTQVPDPVAVLEALLCDPEGPALVSIDGCARHPAVSAPRAELDTVQ